MPEIGNLLVALQMETASFNRGIAEANNKLTGFGRQFATVSSQIQTHSTAITAAFGRITTAAQRMLLGGGLLTMVNWVRGMADSAEQAENLAAALGLTIPEFLKFDGAMRMVGASADEAGRVLTTLSGKLREALTDPTGQAALAFQDLGIKQEQLKANSNDLLGVMGLLADAWQKMPDGPQKTAMFADLLSTRFRVLVGMFKDGSAGARELMAEFERLNPGFLAAHEAANQVDKQFDALATTIRAVLGAAFADLQPFIATTTRELQALAEMANAVMRAINTVRNLQHGSDIATADIPPPPPAAPPNRPIPLKTTPMPKGGGGGGGRRRGGGGSGAGAGKAAMREAEKDARDVQREAIQGLEEQERIADANFRRSVQRIKHEADVEKLTAQEALDAERKLLEDRWTATQEFYAKKLAAAVADKDEMRKLQNEQKQDEIRYLTERDQLLQQGQKNSFDKTKELMQEIGSTIKSTFESAFESIIAGTFKLRDAIGNLLKDIGKKLASKGFDALFDKLSGSASGGGIFDKLLGLVGLGGGGGLTAAFAGGKRSTLDFSGTSQFATGGSFRVGGAGALDSQLVAFRASPGEMVDVHHGDRGRGGETVRIELNPSEGWVAGVADQRIVTRSGQIIDVAVRQSSKTVQRNFAGMSADAQARQM